jgi:phthiocerol/phenolphthiocerol synthesis type-I polyketide synthase E
MVESLTKTSVQEVTPANNETVRQIAGIWKEILRVDSVGVNQNYFDLGGDSIMAVRVFAEIERVFNVKLPLATLFEAPTVEELARLVRQDAAESDWSSLVPIQPLGSRPTFFCVHGAGGNVLIYRELSKCLGSDQPFYGLQAQGLDGNRPVLVTIEEMATLYVKEMRKAQPHGPYMLGGYCMGGTIAFEIAQRLAAAGEQVALLALFDTVDWSKIKTPSAWDKLYFSAQRLGFHAANFFRLDRAGKWKFLSEKVHSLKSRLPVWRGMLLTAFDGDSSSSVSGSKLLGQVWRANDRACVNYRPRAYSGPLTDFRPIKQYRLYDKPEAKWSELAQGRHNVIVLPVYPAGMLVEPLVEQLAIALRRAIDEAILNGQRSSPY